jgi:hypothetical protein
MTSDKYATILFPLVESCIPEDVLRVWLRNTEASIRMMMEAIFVSTG